MSALSSLESAVSNIRSSISAELATLTGPIAQPNPAPVAPAKIQASVFDISPYVEKNLLDPFKTFEVDALTTIDLAIDNVTDYLSSILPADLIDTIHQIPAFLDYLTKTGQTLTGVVRNILSKLPNLKSLENLIRGTGIMTLIHKIDSFVTTAIKMGKSVYNMVDTYINNVFDNFLSLYNSVAAQFFAAENDISAAFASLFPSSSAAISLSAFSKTTSEQSDDLMVAAFILADTDEILSTKTGIIEQLNAKGVTLSAKFMHKFLTTDNTSLLKAATINKFPAIDLSSLAKKTRFTTTVTVLANFTNPTDVINFLLHATTAEISTVSACTQSEIRAVVNILDILSSNQAVTAANLNGLVASISSISATVSTLSSAATTLLTTVVNNTTGEMLTACKAFITVSSDVFSQALTLTLDTTLTTFTDIAAADLNAINSIISKTGIDVYAVTADIFANLTALQKNAMSLVINRGNFLSALLASNINDIVLVKALELILAKAAVANKLILVKDMITTFNPVLSDVAKLKALKELLKNFIVTNDLLMLSVKDAADILFNLANALIPNWFLTTRNSETVYNQNLFIIASNYSLQLLAIRPETEVPARLQLTTHITV